MFDIAQLFVSSAWAQSADAAASATASGFSLKQLSSFAPLFLIFAVFYVLIIRPQQKKIAEQDRMIKALKRGDRIVTTGGLYGKIVRLEDSTLTVEIAEGVNVKVARAQVQSLAAKTDTAVVANDGTDEDRKN